MSRREMQPARLSFELLLDYVEGRLSPQDSSAVEARLSQADAATRDNLAWIETFWEVRRSGALEPTPPSVCHFLRQRFQRWAARRPAEPGLMQRIQAVLRFDTWDSAALAGARDVQIGSSIRQLLYESDLADVELYLMSDVAGLRLLGQILPTTVPTGDPAGWLVVLQDAGGAIQYAVTNDLGEFRFFEVLPGPATLTVVEAGREIVLESVDLR